jgi:ribosome-associated translation inhibitor RaiA
MSIPLTINFRDLEPSAAVEGFIRGWACKLETVYDRIERCHVTIERPHRPHHQGQRYHVHVTVAVPGSDIEVRQDHALDRAHEDLCVLYVAIRDAFRAVRRQLEDHARRQRADIVLVRRERDGSG